MLKKKILNSHLNTWKGVFVVVAVVLVVVGLCGMAVVDIRSHDVDGLDGEVVVVVILVFLSMQVVKLPS